MYSKKGVSGHIEIIISFLIFLAFVSFLLFFVNPVEENKETTHYLDMTEKAIMEYLKANLSEFSLTLNAAPAARSCVCFDYLNPPEKISGMAGNNVIIKLQSGTITPGLKIRSQICFETAAGERFYRLYFSEEFEGQIGMLCGAPGFLPVPLPPANYTLGVYNEYEKVSNKSLSQLDEAYDTNYPGLISTLNLGIDFNMFVRNMRNEQIAYAKNREPPKSNVMAKDIPVEMISNNGEITPAVINLQVWE